MKRMQRSLAAVLAGAVVASSMTFGAFAADFTDTEGHWGAGSVERWADYGVIQGANGKFNPDASMTRAEMATTLVNLLGLTEKGENGFSDVQSGAWYEDAILKCAAAGIIKGNGTGANPGGKITREEAAVMLGRALGIEPASGSVSFGDGAQVSDWAAGYVKAMSEKGILSGMGNNSFAPKVDISRASVTTILDKSITTYVDKPGTYTLDDKGIVLVKAAGQVTLTGAADSVLVAAGAAQSGITLDKLTVSGAVTVDAAKAEITAKDSKLETVQVNAEAGAVKLSGTSTAAQVTVAETAAGAVLTVDKTAKVETAVIEAKGTTTSIAGTVKSVAVSETASGTKIEVAAGATVSKLETAGDKTAVTGSGKIENLTVTGGEGTTVAKETTVTKVENKGDSSVTVGDKVIKPDSDSGSTNTGGSSGGGSSSSNKKTMDVVAAPLVDTSDEPQTDLAKDYSVSAVKYSSKAYVDVTVKATDVKIHKAGNGKYGYWVGISVPYKDTARVVQGWGEIPTTLPACTAEYDGTFDKDGKTYGSVYFNYGSEDNTELGYVLVDEDGDPNTTNDVTQYRIDFSGVKLALTKAATAEALQTAIDAAKPGEIISISEQIGSQNDYRTFKIAKENVTILGGVVYGSFVVTVDGARFKEVEIFNQGQGSDITDAAQKNGINAYTKNITIKGCKFVSANSFANGVALFPSAAEVDYNITDNTFEGYKNGDDNWSTSGLIITGGYTMSAKPFFGVEGDAAIPTNVDDAMMMSNKFVDCQIDYSRSSWTVNNTKYTSYTVLVSNGGVDSLNLSYAITGSKAYVNGNMTIADERTVESGAELIVTKGNTLTVGEGAILTVSGTLTVEEGATLVVDGALNGDGTINGEAIVSSAAALSGALAFGGNVKLAEDISINANDISAAWKTKTVVLDLNKYTLTLAEGSGSAYVGPAISGEIGVVEDENNCDTTDVTIRNGKIIANNQTAQYANFVIEKGHSLTLDGIDGEMVINGAGSTFLPRGTDAKLTVRNSTISTTGVYVISTNASIKNGVAVNSGVVIDVEDSDLKTTAADGDACAVLINVPATVNISGGSITGQRQALAVRSGTVEVDGTIISAEIGEYTTDDRVGGKWSSGDELDFGAVVVGKVGTAYKGDINLSLKDCTLSCTMLDGSKLDPKYCSALFVIDTKPAGAGSVTVTLDGSTVAAGNVIGWDDVGLIKGFDGDILAAFPIIKTEEPEQTSEEVPAAAQDTVTEPTPTDSEPTEETTPEEESKPVEESAPVVESTPVAE